MTAVNLALQGGGAHGAFTWGALDRLLEDASIDIDGITATSAGAMNAAYETCSPVLVVTRPTSAPSPTPRASR